MRRRRTGHGPELVSTIALVLFFSVSALSALPEARASPAPGDGGTCDGLVLHVNVPTSAVTGVPIAITANAIAETGCSIWGGMVDVKVFFVNQTTQAKTYVESFQVQSDGGDTSETLPSQPLGIYDVEFDGSGDGYTADVTGLFAVIHGPCNYAGNFLFNGQAQVTVWELAPKDDCTWTVHVTYPLTSGSEGFFHNISYTGPVGGLNLQSQIAVNLPNDPFPASITVDVVDQYGWENFGDNCDQGTAVQHQCKAWNAYNYAASSYPWLAFTPFDLILVIVFSIVGLAGLGLVTRIGITQRDQAEREEFHIEPN